MARVDRRSTLYALYCLLTDALVGQRHFVDSDKPQLPTESSVQPRRACLGEEPMIVHYTPYKNTPPYPSRPPPPRRFTAGGQPENGLVFLLIVVRKSSLHRHEVGGDESG